MYVWFRLARMALPAKARGPYRMGGESRLAFRCLPSDIASNLHLNNARYMMLADVGRIDIFLRAGLLRLARERGWAPMLGGLQTVFVREVRLWRRFQVVSTVETWQGTQVIGAPELVLLRGTVLVENDELVASPGIGQFVARAKSGEELAPAGAAVTGR